MVSIWIADADGRVRAGSQPWNPAVGIREREFFQVQRARDRGAFISGGFRGKATERASFAISRRRATPDGHFDGTIHISLSPEYFARTYAAIVPEGEYVASLLRTDGQVLVHEPYREVNTALGPDSPLLQRIAAEPNAGYFVGTSTLDGTERAVAYRRIGGYPVYVVIGVATAVLRGQWIENLAMYGAAAGLAAAMLLLVSWLAVRGRRTEQAALARLHVAHEQLRNETAQREAAEQRMRQSEKMEAVGKLTGGIAHDFNNLLTAVLGSLQLLRKRLPATDERAVRLWENAVRGAERGAALTQRLLAFSRGQVLKPEALHLAQLLEDGKALLQSSLGVGVEVERNVPSDLPPARVDANQLELAVLNLALNARDAMPCGGKLKITGRAEQVAAGRDSELVPGNYVVLSIADTGEGMSQTTLARAVEPFFTTKGVGKGTGLGLSMVHGLAAQSGGRLALHSRKGEGTTAELWLPQADGASMLAAAPAPAETLHRRKVSATVLLVDDDRLVLSSAGPMLEDLGYRVLTAASGAEALKVFRSRSGIDFVITDQAMPGLTGLQLAAQLREIRPDLPILVASGYSDRQELLSSGLMLLDKPFDQAALVNAIEQLGIHGAANAA